MWLRQAETVELLLVSVVGVVVVDTAAPLREHAAPEDVEHVALENAVAKAAVSTARLYGSDGELADFRAARSRPSSRRRGSLRRRGRSPSRRSRRRPRADRTRARRRPRG